jgi:3D (Asp-Asp-Asp) domain-containing protein
MTKNITIIILALTLTLVTFLSLMMFNNYERDMLSMADQQLNSDNLHLEALDGLTQQYNQLVTDYDKLNSSYIALGKEKGLSDNWSQFVLTAYSPSDVSQGTTDITFIGIRTDAKLPMCATDPNIIPIGKLIEIKDLGFYLTVDAGGAIKGNRIDIFMADKNEAIEFGKVIKDVRVIK